MKLLRNLEAVFVVSVALACSASVLLEKSAQATAQWPSTNIATPEKMAIVTVSAKRMSTAEKLQSLREERELAALKNRDESRI